MLVDIQVKILANHEKVTLGTTILISKRNDLEIHIQSDLTRNSQINSTF